VEARNKQEASESSACYLLHADFLFGLSFDYEDGGYVFS
jgi:hypothetical protein